MIIQYNKQYNGILQLANMNRSISLLIGSAPANGYASFGVMRPRLGKFNVLLFTFISDVLQGEGE